MSGECLWDRVFKALEETQENKTNDEYLWFSMYRIDLRHQFVVNLINGRSKE